MVPPGALCRSHLLGEHRELHALVGIIAKGTRLDGYVDSGLIDTASIKPRHEALVAEMLQRGYNHYSPLEYTDEVGKGHVNGAQNIKELTDRCMGCKERIDMLRPQVGDRVRVIGVMDDPDPLPVGLEGTVTYVTPASSSFQQYQVDWDESRRSLMLLPHDPFQIIGA